MLRITFYSKFSYFYLGLIYFKNFIILLNLNLCLILIKLIIINKLHKYIK